MGDVTWPRGLAGGDRARTVERVIVSPSNRWTSRRARPPARAWRGESRSWSLFPLSRPGFPCHVFPIEHPADDEADSGDPPKRFLGVRAHALDHTAPLAVLVGEDAHDEAGGCAALQLRPREALRLAPLREAVSWRWARLTRALCPRRFGMRTRLCDMRLSYALGRRRSVTGGVDKALKRRYRVGRRRGICLRSANTARHEELRRWRD